jgi:transposase InsO family protein
MLEGLVQTEKKRPFYETATPQEWIAAFTEWVESHRGLDLTTLDDEAISRESIYGERG